MIPHFTLLDLVVVVGIGLGALGCLAGFLALLATATEIRTIRTPLERRTPEPRTVRVLRTHDHDRED